MHFSIKIKESLALGRMIPLRGHASPSCSSQHYILIYLSLSRSRLLWERVCAQWWLHAAAAESSVRHGEKAARALLSSGTAIVCVSLIYFKDKNGGPYVP